MERVFNFSAGPSMLPLPVLQQAQKDLLCYPGAGCSVMEMSHRSRSFEEIIGKAESTLRRVMDIPEDYAVLFLQGGASLQFSMVPMNLASRGQTTNYAVTGQFAGKAWEEAKRWGDAVCVASGRENSFSALPAVTPETLTPGAAYLHITGNNTVYGTCWNTLPQTGEVPLVCDLSSAILGKAFDVRRFALLYAGAQKNLGPAGLTVVILRRSLLERELDPVVPSMLSYKKMADAGSMYNTPPCWSIYVAGLVFAYVEEQGGVAAMQKRNEEKAALLYRAVERSQMFRAPAVPKDRSIMNVVFTLPDEELTKAFLKMAEGRGMINLKGHRSVGGCRASLYNAMPREGVECLCDCMADFENGKRE